MTINIVLEDGVPNLYTIVLFDAIIRCLLTVAKLTLLSGSSLAIRMVLL